MSSYQMRLEQALDTWRNWQSPFSKKPTVLEKINSGYTNRSYLVGDRASAVILRLNHPDSKTLGINRRHEYHILQSIRSLNIAPKIVYWSKAMNFAVFEFIDGRVWTDKDFLQAEQHQRLMDVIAKYRSVALDIASFSYHSYLNSYWHKFKLQGGNTALYQKDWDLFNKQLKLYERLHKNRVLTHHDLVAENIIETNNGIKIIDWEYAGLGIAALDDYFVTKHSRKNIYKAKYQMARNIISWWDKLWWEIR